MIPQTKHWDAVARRYVEGADPEPAETFGPMHLYGVHEAVRVGIDHAAAGSDKTAYLVADTYKRLPKMMGRLYEADNDNRRGDWMQTYTGRQFWPMDPRPEEVFVEDIAHALSMQCRYAGHSLRFYSVAEHSVHLARHFSHDPNLALWALLHDASEAYLVDVPRPVKPFLPGYKEAEARVMAAICDSFGLPHEMPSEVHEADGAIIGDERANMAPCVAEWYATGGPLGIELQYWSPDEAETEFLLEFVRLIDARRAAA